MTVNSTMSKMLLQMIGIGIVMGIVFPIYAGFFVNWIPERKLFFTVGCLLAGVIVGLVNFLIANKTLVKPLTLLIKKSNQAAMGDLTVCIELEGNDIVGNLAHSMNTMFNNTVNLLLQVRDLCTLVSINSQELIQRATENLSATKKISDSVKSSVISVEQGSEEQKSSVENALSNLQTLNDVISQIAQGAMEQSANMGTAADRVHEIVSSIKEVEISSKIFADEAKNTESSAQEGHKAIQSAIKGMGNIQAAVSDASSKIHELGNKSEQISAIIGVIQEIAEQTNLLALNAAIESARAGEHGKGFAVVADEVRKLAEISSKSTKEITLLLQSNRYLTDEVVRVIETGMNEVSYGSRLAENANQALDNILANIKKTSKQISHISSTLTGITNSSNELAQMIDNVTSISQENTASSEEMSAGSEQVLSSIRKISFLSGQSADVVRQIGNSIQEMNSINEDISQRAEQLANMSAKLQNSINSFKVS